MNYDKQSFIKAKQSLVAQSVLNDSVLKKKLSFTKIEFRGFSSYLQRTTYIETAPKTKWIGQNHFV